MKDENRKIFEENRKHYDTLVNAGYMVHLSGGDRSNLVKAMSEEFQAGYSADLWCPPCVSNMMHQVYRRYLAFLEEEKRQQEQVQVPPELEPMPPTISPDAQPIQTKANFPSHKQNHRRR